MKHARGIEKRGKITHRRNPIMLYATEGDNETEENYFNNYKTRDGLRLIPADRHVTDPVNMMNNLLKQAKEMELDVKIGDQAFCLIDTDANKDKQAQIDFVCSKQTSLVQVITSTPCFEEWFLCHYRFSTKPLTSDGAVKEMENHCPGYKKTDNIYPQIKESTHFAIENAKRLEQHHMTDGKRIQSTDSNPETEVYKVVEFIFDSRKK